jgi:hypothetical protein
MASLLGQFFTFIKGSQEDIASMGVSYILQSSKSARDSINTYIYNKTSIELGNINYSTQNVGQKLERTDISGFDDDGKEVIIFEAKFWAALTKNQPIVYLNRLSDDSVLVFICPKLREISLFEEIDLTLNNNNIEHETVGNVFHLDKNKFILIIDWNSILGLIKHALLQNNENISDIEQIIGFCEIIDNTTFLPIQDVELSPSIARRINSFADLVDKVIDKLRIHITINLDNLRATGQKYGYTRYFRCNNYGMSLELNMKYWENTFDTPFWLTIQNIIGNHWEQTEELKKDLKTKASKNRIKFFLINKVLMFPIIPKIDLVEEDVIKYISEDIINIVKELT